MPSCYFAAVKKLVSLGCLVAVEGFCQAAQDDASGWRCGRVATGPKRCGQNDTVEYLSKYLGSHRGGVCQIELVEWPEEAVLIQAVADPAVVGEFAYLVNHSVLT